MFHEREHFRYSNGSSQFYNVGKGLSDYSVGTGEGWAGKIQKEVARTGGKGERRPLVEEMRELPPNRL